MDATQIRNVWGIGNSTGGQTQKRPESTVVDALDDSLENRGPKDEQNKILTQRNELKEIERIMYSHESVEDAVAVLRYEEDSEDAEIVGFVTLRTPGNETQIESHGHPGDDYETQRVQFWEAYWDGCTYTTIDNVQPKPIGRDFMGWTSMYDGKEIDNAEMNEWLDDTIKTILNGNHPLDVLELGTGSGMILFNLINGLSSYVGLDVSQTAVEFVSETAKSIPDLANKVHVHQATAADLDSLNISNSPNLVVVNSVAQYFPSQYYLLQVVEDLLKIQSVRTLFFGDVRSYALYEEFLASKALHMTEEKASKEDLREIMAGIAKRELELLIDPAFFTALPSRFPDLIEHVEVLPKRVKATNELSRYRYTAVVHVKDRGQVPRRQEIYEVRDDEWIDFIHHGLDSEALLRHLESSLGVVAVSNIPYSKTVLERYVIESLHDRAKDDISESGDWISSIRQDAQDCPALSALDLVELAKQAGYRVELSWARQYSQRGGLDAIFHHYQPPDGQSRVMFRFPTDHEGRASNTLISQPLQLQANQMIQEQLNESLQSKLPVHLVPEQITILEELPIDENGEVDRRALAERA